jgi:hypothetical protein
MYSAFINLYDALKAVNFGITNQQISEAKKIIEEHYDDTQIMASTLRHRKFLIFQSMASGC